MAPWQTLAGRFRPPGAPMFGSPKCDCSKGYMWTPAVSAVEWSTTDASRICPQTLGTPNCSEVFNVQSGPSLSSVSLSLSLSLPLALSLSLRTSTVVANLQSMCRCLYVSWPWWLQGSLHLDFVGRCFGGQSSPISGAPPPCHTLPPINNEVWKGNGHRKIFQEERERQQTRHTHNQCISETHEARHANHW